MTICADEARALIAEDEVFAPAISGPAGGAGVRNERRSPIDTMVESIPRERL